MTAIEMVRIARLANNPALDPALRAIYVFQCYEIGKQYGVRKLKALDIQKEDIMLHVHRVTPDVCAQLIRFFN